MAGPAYSPDGMGYMLGAAGSAGSTPAADQQAAAFRSALASESAGAMGSTAASLASHAAMQSAMAGAYSAQHLSQYGRSQHSSQAAMLGLSAGQAAGPHMMGAHPALPPHEYY